MRIKIGICLIRQIRQVRLIRRIRVLKVAVTAFIPTPFPIAKHVSFPESLVFLVSTDETQEDGHCVKSVQIWCFFWSVFSCILTEYGDLRSKYPYSVQIQENPDQKNSVFEHFSSSGSF